ncbi:MAG: aminopeptidase P family protein [Bacillota bacterium]|nr:aminopeptidase P family protein [Bacillota bacterium]
MEVKERIEKLRELMKKNKMDAYIIPSFDSHHSEYVTDYFKCRQWISGFTGSAGTVVITLKEAGLWTDGRYYIQAERELSGSGIILFKMAAPGTPTYTNWLNSTLPKGSTIGFDGNVFTIDMIKEMEETFKIKNISLKMDLDLIGMLWKDRPSLPSSHVFIHETKYCGKSRTEKFNEVRTEMKSKEADYYLLTSLDDIAWLLNIRGNDVPNNPVVMSNVILSLNNCYLFIDDSKITKEVKTELETDGIEIKAYTETADFLKMFNSSDTVLYDSSMTNAYLYNAINHNVTRAEYPNVTSKLKSVKNKTELENLRQCQILDGAAMVKFIKWLKTSPSKEQITEISLSDELEKLRIKNPLCVGTSFDTIAAYKDHAAMMHYKASAKSQYALKNESLLLVDSGGQYFKGTTDITRTIVLGKLTDEEKRDFTLVLKCHIALDTTKFLYGATGSNLDAIARQPVWKYGIDYKCGTGHGVGFFLNVHEGPQRLSPIPNTTILEESMILTNEPGIYRENKHGIRTENMMVVVKDEETEFGQFMKFEAITYCPIDLDGIDKTLLTQDEINWLNNYHKNVYDKLSPYLNEEEKDWLKKETRYV